MAVGKVGYIGHVEGYPYVHQFRVKGADGLDMPVIYCEGAVYTFDMKNRPASVPADVEAAVRRTVKHRYGEEAVVLAEAKGTEAFNSHWWAVRKRTPDGSMATVYALGDQDDMDWAGKSGNIFAGVQDVIVVEDERLIASLEETLDSQGEGCDVVFMSDERCRTVEAD